MESAQHIKAKTRLAKWIREYQCQADELGGDSVYLWGVEIPVNAAVHLEYVVPHNHITSSKILSWSSTPPKFHHLKERPRCVIDLAIVSHQHVLIAFEVIFSHALPDWKRSLLSSHDVKVLELSATRILQHTKPPALLSSVIYRGRIIVPERRPHTMLTVFVLR